jgi:hypothetical protein
MRRLHQRDTGHGGTLRDICPVPNGTFYRDIGGPLGPHVPYVPVTPLEGSEAPSGCPGKGAAELYRHPASCAVWVDNYLSDCDCGSRSGQ